MHTKLGAMGLIGLALVMLFCATAPAAAHLKGAVWTTAADGAKVNANLYDQKCPPVSDPCVVPPLVPFLNGGPSFASANRWVPTGWYYFQVTDPAGKVLLSTDDIGDRMFYVGEMEYEGRMVKYVEYSGPHLVCQDEGYPYESDTIALCPMDDTPNNGGVYKLWITRTSDWNPADPHARFGFIPAYSKTDNFKVKGLASVWGDKVDEVGDPVEGLHILLYKQKKVKGQVTWVFVDETCTDGNGEFSFTELSAGKYKVQEDLDLSLCSGCGCDDYSGWEPLSPTEIIFNITKADLGGKGKNAGPGEPIYVGQFVNQIIVRPKVSLRGVKFLDVNGNGDLDGADGPLADWVITLEEWLGNGDWQQAYDKDGVLVEPQVTPGNGAFDFGNLAVDKVYRICEYKWVDTANIGILDYTYNAVTNTFGGECVLPADAGWLQTAPSAGDPGPYVVQPAEAEDDILVDVVTGCFVLEVGPGAPDESIASDLRFGNTLAELCVEKRDACTEEGLAGFEFTLYESDCTTLVEYDGLGNAVAPVVTDSEGSACWDNLLAGTYCVKETAEPGWIVVGPDEQAVTVPAGGSASVTFENWAPSMGLTPGYWKNWRNHYTSAQFCELVQGTVADVDGCTADIAAADAIFEHWDASPGDEMTIVLAFLLANQLTLNLTQTTLPNPSEGSLVPGSSIECDGTPIVLSDVIEDALACVADSCSRDDLLTIKNWLACFAESRYSTPPCLPI